MKYRQLGAIEWKPSALGFGCMRLPEKDGKIDYETASGMLSYAIDHGINYIDTAWPYHNGESEEFVGKALSNSLRKKVMVATKMPCWLIESYADFDKYFDEQRKRLQTEHIDFYLLHALFSARWESMEKLNVLKWADDAVASGKIGYFGFSFHDSFPMFKKIIDSYDKWSFCQIQYNYTGEQSQAGTEGLKYAAQKGLGVIIMEPLFGGLLANPPDEINVMWKQAEKNPVDMAFRWLWDKPEVSLVLSGMSTMAQVEEDVLLAAHSGIGTITEEEAALIARVCEVYKELTPIPCTKCGYCMPCPNGVDIPRNFEIYNDAVIYRKLDSGRGLYNWHMPEKQQARSCVGCRECEEKCPQQIAISEWMPKVHDALVFKDQK